jgi:aspartokinase-like uncharacterized kinase
LQNWLAKQTSAQHVLIAGGGDLADVLRRWDDLHAIGEERSHWLCVQALSISASVLAAMIPDVLLLTHFADLQSKLRAARDLQRGATVAFDLHEFLLCHEQALPPSAVPHNWSVSSDSLAARLAEVIAADELVLLKSVPPFEPTATFQELAARDYVDGHFPLIAPRLHRVSFQVI